jgi:hypothetical protein
MSRPPLDDLWPRLAGWQMAAVVHGPPFRVLLKIYVRKTDKGATAKGIDYDVATAAVYKAALLANKGQKPFADAQPFLDALIEEGLHGGEWRARLVKECNKRPDFAYLEMC